MVQIKSHSNISEQSETQIQVHNVLPKRLGRWRGQIDHIPVQLMNEKCKCYPGRPANKTKTILIIIIIIFSIIVVLSKRPRRLWVFQESDLTIDC